MEKIFIGLAGRAAFLVEATKGAVELLAVGTVARGEPGGMDIQFRGEVVGARKNAFSRIFRGIRSVGSSFVIDDQTVGSRVRRRSRGRIW